MTVDRCHNRFVALFWFRCFVAQVASRLTSPQLEDVHERSTVHALAAGATCVTRHTSHVAHLVSCASCIVQELVLVLRRMAAENKIDLDLPNIHLKN